MIPSKTREELIQIARDFKNEKIFSDRHLQIHGADKSMLTSVFMPILFFSKEQFEQLQDDPPGIIYEYLDKAGPMAINGFPIFMSLQILNREDTKTMIDLMHKMIDAEKALEEELKH